MISRLRGLSRSKFIRDTLVLQASKLGTTALSVIALAVSVRLMGNERYGVWKLTLAFFSIWQAVEMSGVGMSTATRLSIAIGKKDESEILNLMAFYVKVVLLWAAATTLVMVIFGPPTARLLYNGDSRIGELAAWFSLTVAADVLYTLVVVSLQSRRLMREFALLQNANQVVLFVCIVVAMFISATPESMVVGRLVYSYSTVIMALVVYARYERRGMITFPSMSAVFRHAPHVPTGPYWRSGVAMALDKNVGNLYTQFPITLAGIVGGVAAAGYLGTALDVISRSSLLTGPIMDNMQAVVPQTVGRGDYAGLRRNFGRVMVGLGVVSIAFYGLLALFAPLIIPLWLGSEAAPTIAPLIALCVFGVITAVGGIFGPLYRALPMMRMALVVKIVAVLIMLPVGYVLISQWGALGGAWMVNGLYLVSVGLTAVFTLPELGRRAGIRSEASVVSSQ
jgi:O-antigen/teichoic acid export membrane protein